MMVMAFYLLLTNFLLASTAPLIQRIALALLVLLTGQVDQQDEKIHSSA